MSSLPRSTLMVAAALSLLLVAASVGVADPAVDRPLPAELAARQMRLPDGFQATLFAGEPDLVQPIAFTFDPRGRLWVAESLSHPNWAETGNDRISIFEDIDHDGRFDRKKVFWNQGNYITGLEIGFGGVWVISPPHLLFLPDANGDDVPDGPAVPMLDGWSHRGIHNIASTLTWGPDGWLYGGNGTSSPSWVGLPGSTRKQRIYVDGGIWRFHPTRRRLEVVASGMCNPWGIDFNEFGELFATSSVVEHLWHIVPGMRLQRRGVTDTNPHTYEMIGPCCDHIHWGGGEWHTSRGGVGAHGTTGGGHAHAGAMIYQADNWPAKYRGRIFTVNIHGQRVNCDSLERRASGYVGRHDRDFLLAADPWFRGVAVKYGPDGAVYLSDWNDTGECHDRQPNHRETGRIYKITYTSADAAAKTETLDSNAQKTPAMDLARLRSAQLVELHRHSNQWYVRTARRLLLERRQRGEDLGDAVGLLDRMYQRDKETQRRLAAMWTLRALGELDDERLLDTLDSQRMYLRVWAIRFLAEDENCPHDAFTKFVSMALGDPSPRVRLELASALTRIPMSRRWDIAAALVSHAEDAGDPNLPLMIWYAIEPLVPKNVHRALQLAADSRLPLIRRHIARRAAASGNFDSVLDFAVDQKLNVVKNDLLRGTLDGLKGRRGLKMPAFWPDIYKDLANSDDAATRNHAIQLALLFDDAAAIAQLRETMNDDDAEETDRLTALNALVSHRIEGLSTDLHQLVASEGPLRTAAIVGLAAYDDPQTARLLLARYQDVSAADRAATLTTLAARPSNAKRLLRAIAAGNIPRGDLNAVLVRQLMQFEGQGKPPGLEKIWGKVNTLDADQKRQVNQLRNKLPPITLADADVANGRGLFTRHCGNCHRLHGEGGALGPDLTGSQRHNLEYLLEHILVPNAIVAQDYQLTTITLNEGRVVQGMLGAQTKETVELISPDGKQSFDRDEIESLETSQQSIMPNGLLNGLTDDQVRDLIGYLMRDPGSD